MITDASPAERKLFEHFQLEILLSTGTFMPMLLTMLGTRAFIDNDQSPYAEALRRGLRLLENDGFRGTPEWEALISVPE
jgi:hypothetical protein